MSEFDLVVRNGAVVDGTGLPSRRADVAVIGDSIVEVGRVRGRGRREVDADGHVVTPGFVDGHTHMDAQVFWDPLRLVLLLARRDQRRHGQLRLHAGAGAARRPCARRAQPRARRGHLPGGPGGGHRLVVGDLRRVPRCRRSRAEVDQLRRAGRPLGAAHVGDGRAGLRGGGRRRRHGADAARPRRRPAGRRHRVHDLAQRHPPDVGRAAGRVADRHMGRDHRARRARWRRSTATDCSSCPWTPPRRRPSRPCARRCSIGCSASPSTSACPSRSASSALETSTAGAGCSISSTRPTRPAGTCSARALPREATLLLSFLTRLPFDRLTEWAEIRTLPLEEQRAMLLDPAIRQHLVEAARARRVRRLDRRDHPASRLGPHPPVPRSHRSEPDDQRHRRRSGGRTRSRRSSISRWRPTSGSSSRRPSGTRTRTRSSRCSAPADDPDVLRFGGPRRLHHGVVHPVVRPVVLGPAAPGADVRGSHPHDDPRAGDRMGLRRPGPGPSGLRRRPQHHRPGHRRPCGIRPSTTTCPPAPPDSSRPRRGSRRRSSVVRWCSRTVSTPAPCRAACSVADRPVRHTTDHRRDPHDRY